MNFFVERPLPPPRPFALTAALAAQFATEVAAVVAAVVTLAGCATAIPDPTPPAPQATRWQAPLPHGGDIASLATWWSGFDDPLLPALIAEAQAASPTLAQARARIVQARATQRSTEAGLWPSVSLQAQGSRSTAITPPTNPVSQATIGPQAAWEIDLFGAQRRSALASSARAEQARLGWHDARVSLAAELAQSYVNLRGCEALVAVYADESDSQARTAALTRAKVGVGFEAPANGALADALAAQARDRLAAQRAECDVTIKALVQLGGQDEAALRERLAAHTAALPQPGAAAAPPSLPAALLAQRPDLAASAQDLLAAASDVGAADAARYPQLTLAGNLSWGVVRTAGTRYEGASWSIGPTINLPILDGGRLAAQAESARGRYDEARAAFDERLRGAVREVEEALVRLDAAQRREADAGLAAGGLREYFEAAQTRWRIGAGSLIDMEDARRTALAAQAGLIGVQRERVAAWVSLYRAAGGGWSSETPGP
jgi:outer membrane protein, multidrug efflux system